MDSLSNIPKSWREVSVAQFLELSSLDPKSYHSTRALLLDQLFILTDTDSEDEMWDDVDSSLLGEVLEKLQWLQQTPSQGFKEQLTLDDIQLTFKKINTLTLGEWIDLNFYFEKSSSIEELSTICAILYRKTRTDEWGHTLIEPRSYNTAERAQLFYDAKITDIYGVMNEFLKYRADFIKDYEHLFEEPDRDEEEDLEILKDPQSTQEERDAIHQAKVSRKWVWEHIIYRLSQDNLLNFDAVTELPLIFVMNQLSMIADLKLWQ